MSTSRSRPRVAILAAAAVLASVIAACSGGRGRAHSVPVPRPVIQGHRLSEAEARYGQAPIPNPAVRYQPDVVMIGGGADSVRGESESGVQWQLKGSAPGVSDLARGKVMFATARAVGRVLDLRKVGHDVVVTVAPVELNEVVADGDFSGKVTISDDQVIAYQAPRLLGAFVNNTPPAPSSTPTSPTTTPPSTPPTTTDSTSATTEGARFGSFAHASLVSMRSTAEQVPEPPIPGGPPIPGSPNLPTPPVPPLPALPPIVTYAVGLFAGHGNSVSEDNFTVNPACCQTGVGLSFKYDDGAVTLAGGARLRMTAPAVAFSIKMSAASILNASVELSGGLAVHLDLNGRTNQGVSGDFTKTLRLPLDFTVPLGHFLGFPLELVFHQAFKVGVAFTAKGASISGAGDYGIVGSFGLGFSDGTFHPIAPTTATTTYSFLKSLKSAPSLGVNALLMTYETRLQVGLGAFGFSAGPYVGLTASVGPVTASSLDPRDCKLVVLDMAAEFGLSWTIPTIVKDILNLFTKAFSLPPVESSGKLVHTAPISFVNRQGVDPPLKSCQL